MEKYQHNFTQKILIDEIEAVKYNRTADHYVNELINRFSNREDNFDKPYLF